MISDEQLKLLVTSKETVATHYRDDFAFVVPVSELETELLQRRDADRWIPVTERLPKEETTVIMTNGKAVETGCYFGESWFQGGHAIIGVTHYRPLPAPPQEANDTETP